MQDFQGASSAAAAKAMKSELSKLAAQIQDEGERKVKKIRVIGFETKGIS